MLRRPTSAPHRSPIVCMRNLSGLASPSTAYCHVPRVPDAGEGGRVVPTPLGCDGERDVPKSSGPLIAATTGAQCRHRAVIGPQSGGGCRRHGHGTTDSTRLAVRRRLNQVDFRLARRFKLTRGRVEAQSDLYNLFTRVPFRSHSTPDTAELADADRDSAGPVDQVRPADRA